MIPAAQVVEIRRLFFAEHWRVGTIATQLGLHPDTVRRALATDRFARPAVVRPRLCDPYRAFLQATLQQYPRLRATRLFEMAKARGYPGSVVQLRRVVRTLRPVPAAEAYLRLNLLPGEQGQADWGSFGTVTIGRATRRLSAFVLVLSWSRALHAVFTLDQTLESFLRGHVEAFQALGGVPRVLLLDNLKSAVLERRGDAIRFHPRLLELCGHYHCVPRPCAVGAAHEKGRVERAIRYLREAFFAARTFRDVDDLNAPVRPVAGHGGPRPARPWRCHPHGGRGAGGGAEAAPAAPGASVPNRLRARRDLREDPLHPVRPELVLDPPYLGPGAAHAGGRRRDRATLSRDRGGGRASPKLRRRLHHRGAGAPRGARYRQAAGHRPHTPRPAPQAVPAVAELLERLAVRGEPLGPHVARLHHLLDDYGAVELTAAVAVALARDACGAGSVAHLLERRRRARGQRPPVPVILPDDPRVRDLDVPSHSLETYDDLSRRPDAPSDPLDPV